MSTRNERFNNRILLIPSILPISDGGRGEREIFRAIDCAETESTMRYERHPLELLLLELYAAWLILIGKEHLVRTLELIFRNGREHMRDSIEELAGPCWTEKDFDAARRLYERHRDEIMKLCGVK